MSTTNSSIYTFEIDENNIATISLDMPGQSANTINEAFGEAIPEMMSQIENSENLSGIIFTSAKKNFVVGADIDMLYKLEDPQQIFEMSEQMKSDLRKLETSGLPVVAALNGTALGGGFELALACHYRVAINNPKAKIGLPEVTLGLLPGGGGVTRTVRMMGLEKAAPLLLQGKQLSPQSALKAGWIDALAEDRADMMKQAKEWILSKPEASNPWDRRGFRIPGGDPRNPKLLTRLPAMPALLSKETYNVYPAPQAILNTMVEGATVDFDTASRIESRYFAHLASGQVSKNMIGSFWFQLNEINKGKSRPKDIEPKQTKKLGVIGAGMMGHGITYVSAARGINVVMKDANIEGAQKGYDKIEAIASKAASRKKISEEKKQDLLSRVKPTGEASDFEGCDLIIEAVFESRDLKAQVTAEAESVISEDAVFASNTSTLPITGLAEKSKRPDQFVGLHFFSPVHKMRLVEIIKGEKTNPETLAKAFDYVLQIGKVPIVVNDSRGFYTSRVFSTYTSEGLALLGEGYHPQSVESAGRHAGMPVGPLALIDEVSLKLAYDISNQTLADLDGDDHALASHPGFDVLRSMVEKHDRKGRAYGGGFYDYPQGGKKRLWPGLKDAFPVSKSSDELSEMMDRLLYAQSVETIRCMEEGVLTTVADANIGSVFGWGFAPWSGGTLQFVNHIGVQNFYKRSAELAKKYGARFAPPQLLKEMAENNQIFE